MNKGSVFSYFLSSSDVEDEMAVRHCIAESTRYPNSENTKSAISIVRSCDAREFKIRRIVECYARMNDFWKIYILANALEYKGAAPLKVAEVYTLLVQNAFLTFAYDFEDFVIQALIYSGEMKINGFRGTKSP